MNLRPNFLIVGLAFLPLIATVGCGGSDPNLGQVEGVVRLDGQPLADATLIFVQGQGRPAAGVTDAEGRYRVSLGGKRVGTAAGINRVQISTARGPSETADGTPLPAIAERVPTAYNAESTLVVEVKAGEKVVADFDLQSDTKSAGKGPARGAGLR